MSALCQLCGLPMFEGAAGFVGPQCRCLWVRPSTTQDAIEAGDGTLSRIAELERENAELETKLAEEIRISNERGAFIENRLADMAALEAKLKIAEDAMTAVLENKGGGFAIWGPMVAAALAKIKDES